MPNKPARLSPNGVPLGRPKSLVVQQDKHVKQFTVILPDKTRVMVPVGEIDARNKRKILTARVHEFFDAQLTKLSGQTLTAKEVQEVITAAVRLDDLSKSQYLEALSAADPMGHSNAGALGKMINSAAKGAVEGMPAFFDKLEAMKKAAKSEKKAEAVTVAESDE